MTNENVSPFLVYVIYGVSCDDMMMIRRRVVSDICSCSFPIAG